MFVVPKSEAEKKANRFEFKIGAEKYSIPLIQFLSVAGAEFLTEQAAEVSEAVAMVRLVETECPEAVAAVRALGTDQARALSQAWVEASNATLGESSASDDS